MQTALKISSCCTVDAAFAATDRCVPRLAAITFLLVVKYTTRSKIKSKGVI